MSFYSQQIKSDIDTFQESVQKLSKSIQAVSFLWKDTQYAALASSISALAMQSREVLLTGDCVCESIDKFFDIADEEY